MIHLQVSKTIMKNKEIKLAEIKKHNPTLYSKVVNGEVKLQQAYNETMEDINSTTEYKGRGTKGQNKIGLSKEVDRLNKMYKPTIEEWIEELKRLFPFTHPNHLK
jgi:hypothetical protein